MFHRDSNNISTDSIFIIDVLKKQYRKNSLLFSIKNIFGFFLVRYIKLKSFNKLVFKNIFHKYFNINKEYKRLLKYPYCSFIMQQFINKSGYADAIIPYCSAKYFNKKGIMPFCDPISIYLSGAIKRDYYFDIKKPLRNILIKLGADLKKNKKSIPLKNINDSDIFKTNIDENFVSKYLNDDLIEKLKVSNNNIMKRHLITFFKILEKEEYVI